MLIKLEESLITGDGNKVKRTSSSVLPDSSTVASVHGWRSELDAFYTRMGEFPGLQIDEILITLSSFSARMNFIRTQIVRSENRMMGSFRTKEIDPFIDECDRQFRIWSRMMSMQKFEYDMTRSL